MTERLTLSLSFFAVVLFFYWTISFLYNVVLVSAVQ